MLRKRCELLTLRYVNATLRYVGSVNPPLDSRRMHHSCDVTFIMAKVTLFLLYMNWSIPLALVNHKVYLHCFSTKLKWFDSQQQHIHHSIQIHNNANCHVHTIKPAQLIESYYLFRFQKRTILRTFSTFTSTVHHEILK